jgi:predicted component of type VI protein secretion system
MMKLTDKEHERSAQIHLQNIQDNIRRRLNTARVKDDKKLVEILEIEDDILNLGRSNSKFGM